MPVKVVQHINDQNTDKWQQGSKRTWKYDHLLKGFLVGKAPKWVKDGPDATKTMSNLDAIRNFAYARTLCSITPK